VANGANALAEGFLFMVAAGLIIGETYRGSRSTAKRKDYVDEQLENLQEEISKLKERWKAEEEELIQRTQVAEERCVFSCFSCFPRFY
jgi:gas vesicle protein